MSGLCVIQEWVSQLMMIWGQQLTLFAMLFIGKANNALYVLILSLVRTTLFKTTRS